MLQITVPGYEYFDEQTQTFGYVKDTTLQLEHSLLSLSKWESVWKKPFLGRQDKTLDECRDYVRCMTLTQNVNPLVYMGLTEGNLDEVNRYMEDSMTATWFNEKKERQLNQKAVTAEIIYYWMVALGIPFDPCQKWHLNRLLTLIRVCDIKNAPAKGNTRSSRADLSRRAALNEARKRRLGTRG